MTTLTLQIGHFQYIKRTQPAPASSAARNTYLPRSLRAGLAWAVVWAGLLTQITLAEKAIIGYADPVNTQSEKSKFS